MKVFPLPVIVFVLLASYGQFVALDFNIDVVGAEARWPARYSVPVAMIDFCMGSLSSRGGGFGAIVTGAGGLYPSAES